MTRLAPQVVTMSREDRPHPGSALARLLPNRPGLPPFVMVPEAISPVGPERPGQHAGFLGAAYDPYRINSDPNSPNFSPGALAAAQRPGPPARPPGATAAVDRQARHLEASDAGRTLDPYFTRAFDLISSTAAQRAFDLNAEPASVRDRYGRHIFGQSVLLARRLVEAGVRLVHVNWVRHDNGSGGQGYDSHRDHLAWCRRELLPPTDAACAALLQDLIRPRFAGRDAGAGAGRVRADAAFQQRRRPRPLAELLQRADGRRRHPRRAGSGFVRPHRGIPHVGADLAGGHHGDGL